MGAGGPDLGHLLDFHHHIEGKAGDSAHVIYAHPKGQPFDCEYCRTGNESYKPDSSKFAGHFAWNNDDPWHEPGEITAVETHPKLERRGIANAMFEHAQQYDPPPAHSDDRTDEGTAWAEATGHDVPPMTDMRWADHYRHMWPEDEAPHDHPGLLRHFEGALEPRTWYHGTGRPGGFEPGQELTEEDAQAVPHADARGMGQIWITPSPTAAAYHARNNAMGRYDYFGQGDAHPRVYEMEPLEGLEPKETGARVKRARVKREVEYKLPTGKGYEQDKGYYPWGGGEAKYRPAVLSHFEAAAEDPESHGHKERWQPGERAHFEYHCLEDHCSNDAELWYRSHQQATVTGQQPRSDTGGWEGSTFTERADEAAPDVYHIRFDDGHEGDAFQDELMTHPKHFFRPDPPARPKQAAAQSGLEYHHLLQGRKMAHPFQSVMAADGGTVVGHLSWGPGNPDVQSLWVHPDYRHRGVATALWGHAQALDSPPQHSLDRSDAGDAWARSVTPDAPDRKHSTSTGEELEQRGQASANVLTGRLQKGDDRHITRLAAARPGRGEKQCPCCKGNGEHGDGSECDPCDGQGIVHSNEPDRYCPGQPQPRRRHWREGVRTEEHTAAMADDEVPPVVAHFEVAAMAWNNEHGDKGKYTPVSVRDAGFAGLVGDTEDERSFREEMGEPEPGHRDPWEHFDEDLHDHTAPEPTEQERREHEEDGESESYTERHDQAYEKAFHDRERKIRAEDAPDHEDPGLRRFREQYGSDTDLWKRHGAFGGVSLKQPIYATQSHVAKEHIEKYTGNRDAEGHAYTLSPDRERIMQSMGREYLGDKHPLFVTHEGRVHVIEGHHRVATDMAMGRHETVGWHFNLDAHPALAEENQDEYPEGYGETSGHRRTAVMHDDYDAESAFGDYTLRHRTEDQGERKPRHIIEAYAPDGSIAGRLNWYGTSGVIHHIEVAREEDDGQQQSSPLGNGQNHQRRGLATAMWNWGREIHPKLRHSGDRTPQGADWAKAVGGPGLRSHKGSAKGDRPESMSVQDLLGLHSSEALRRERNKAGEPVGHSDATTVQSLYDRKAAEMAQNEPAWSQLDEPIRNGSIDPVLLETSSDGHTVVTEGGHRIVRAHQLGVTHLPVSYDPGSQAHRYEWDDPEPLEPKEAVVAHFEAEPTAEQQIPYMKPPGPGAETTEHILQYHTGPGHPTNLSREELGLHGGDKHWAHWHMHEHRGRIHETHQHLGPVGTPGETHWPDTFEPSEHYYWGNITGERPAGWHPENHGGFHPLAPAEGALLRHFAVASPDELPPDPGTQPIPEGHVRLWHYTPNKNVASIREHGLQRKYAQGDAMNGDLSDPSAGMWASTKRPDELLDSHDSAKSVVEFHAHPREISGNAESPWQAERKREPGQAYEDREYDPAKLADWASGYHHVIMHGDVHPSQILAIHEPWHAAARYMRDDKDGPASYQWVRDEYAAGKNDHLEPYVRGLDALERQRRPKEGAKRQAALQNPYTGKSIWYHGTQAHPADIQEHGLHAADEFAHGRFEVPDSETDDSGHWNAMLGVHFTADHQIAGEFARGEHEGSDNEGYGGEDEEHHGIIHAHVHLNNPKFYDSEHDLDHDAYEHEFAAGNHPQNHHPGLGKHYEGEPDFDDPDVDERLNAEDMWPHAHRIAQDYGREKIPASTYGHHNSPFEQHPMRTGWLNTHPDKYGIAMRHKQRLMDQGYDGVVYRNEYERSNRGGAANTSIIAFHPERQVEITQHHDADQAAEAPDPEPGGHLATLASLEARPEVVTHFAATDWGRLYDKIPAEIHRGLFAPESHHVFSMPASDEDVAHMLIDAHQREQFPHDRDQHEKFGTHWTASEDVARDFAHEHEREHAADDQDPGHDHEEHFDAVPVVFHARKPEPYEIEEDPRRLGWQNVDDHVEHEGEREVPIKHGAPVTITGVSWLKHTGLGPMWHRHDLREPRTLRAEDRDSPEDENEWNGDRPEPGVVNHFAAAAGKPAQLKMFHWPHQRQPCPECGYKLGGDEEDQLKHIRHVTDDYEPATCEHCGHDENLPREHAEKHHDWLTSQDWYTDWDEEGPGDTIHRGFGADLPDEVHRVVHDQSLPVKHRAQVLMKHLLSPGNVGGAGVGNFWSGEPDVSKTYAESYRRRFGQQNEMTPVMLHAHTPSVEHFETDPDTLQDWGVYSYHNAGNREVPLQNQAPVRIKGVSWAPPGHRDQVHSEWEDQGKPGLHHLDQDPAWVHHEVGGEGIRAHATVIDAEAQARTDADLVAHFAAAGDWQETDEHGTYDDETGLRHHPEKGWWCHGCQAHHDSPQEVEEHDTAHTDWDEIYPEISQKSLHRGISVHLPQHLHEAVHDGTRPVAERARLLSDHLATTNYGTSWSTNPDRADHYAYVSEAGPGATHVIMRAHMVPRESIETDPDELGDRRVLGYDKHEDQEVPLRRGAAVNVHTIEWRRAPARDGSGREPFTSHTFGDRQTHLAAGETRPYVAPPEGHQELMGHLGGQHGVSYSGGKDPSEAFLEKLHGQFHAAGAAHQHEDAGQSREDLISHFFTPAPPRKAPVYKPEPERLDDNEYSIGDVSRRYDWEGFSGHEIEHLVRHPEHATFTREDVPVHSLRQWAPGGKLKKPITYKGIARQGKDERDRLDEVERGMDQGAVPPIVVVRDGEHHIIADGSHRSAIAAERGHSHIEAFVTDRTKRDGEHTAAAGPPSFAWEHEAYGPEGGYVTKHDTVEGPFYHGGRANLKPGGMIKPGQRPNSWGDTFDERGRSVHTYFAHEPETAAAYARETGGHMYEVEPTGKVTYDGSGGDGSWRSEHPLRVIRKIPQHEWDSLPSGRIRHEASAQMVVADKVADGALPAPAPPSDVAAFWGTESDPEPRGIVAGLPGFFQAAAASLDALAASFEESPAELLVPYITKMADACRNAEQDAAEIAGRLPVAPEGAWTPSPEPGPKA